MITDRESLPHEDRIIAALKLQGAAMWAGDLALKLNAPEEVIKQVCTSLARMGVLYKMGNGMFVMPDIAFRLASEAQQKRAAKERAKKAAADRKASRQANPAVKHLELKLQALERLSLVTAPDISDLLAEVGRDLRRLGGAA